MCFRVCRDQRISRKPYIAEKDIEVVKILRNRPIKFLGLTFYRSPFFDGLYIVGIIKWCILGELDLYDTAEGLYSFSNYSSAVNSPISFGLNDICFKGIIKKGSKYYVSDDGTQYCSNKLKLISEIK